MITCCRQQSSAYNEKVEAFHVDKCRANLGSVNQEDLQELKAQIEGVFYHNSWLSVEIFYKNLNTTLLKTLTEK
ncbi:unnamed protein product [Trichobilharzia szidati]|nr:unnamed protein product [Trichobilharzia szidati]